MLCIALSDAFASNDTYLALRFAIRSRVMLCLVFSDTFAICDTNDGIFALSDAFASDDVHCV